MIKLNFARRAVAGLGVALTIAGTGATQAAPMMAAPKSIVSLPSLSSDVRYVKRQRVVRRVRRGNAATAGLAIGVMGVIIGTAIASQHRRPRPVYGYNPYYAPYPYGYPAPVYQPGYSYQPGYVYQQPPVVYARPRPQRSGPPRTWNQYPNGPREGGYSGRFE